MGRTRKISRSFFVLFFVRCIPGVGICRLFGRIDHVEKFNQEARNGEAHQDNDDDQQDLRQDEFYRRPTDKHDFREYGNGDHNDAKECGEDEQACTEKIERLANAIKHYKSREGEGKHHECLIRQGVCTVDVDKCKIQCKRGFMDYV